MHGGKDRSEQVKFCVRYHSCLMFLENENIASVGIDYVSAVLEIYGIASVGRTRNVVFNNSMMTARAAVNLRVNMDNDSCASVLRLQ